MSILRWKRFIQISEKLESLNSKFDQIYYSIYSSKPIIFLFYQQFYALSIIPLIYSDMWQETQIDFQLKTKTLLASVEAKLYQVQSITAPLGSIDPMKIQSEDQIINLVAQIHRTINSLSKVILDVKDFCHELGLAPLYQLFKRVYGTMGTSVRLLAETCQYSVERSLIKFDSGNRNQAPQTLCTETETEKKTEGLYHASLMKRKNQTEQLSAVQIKRIYQNIEKEKQAILRIAPSNAAMKLNEVQISWMRILHDYNEILEEAERTNDFGKEDLGQKSYKPEYLSKVLKQELWESMKTYFKDFTLKTIQKLYAEFYANEQSKLRQQILKSKPEVKSTVQQTDIEGAKQIKQMSKDKRLFEKLNKQLKLAISDKSQISEQYWKVCRNNETLMNKIQQLEKKMKNAQSNSVNRLTHLEKKISEQQQYAVNNKNLSIHKDKQNVDYSTEEARNNIELSEQKKDELKGLKKEEKEMQMSIITQIIKKKKKLQIVYSKHKMLSKNANESQDTHSKFQGPTKSQETVTNSTKQSIFKLQAVDKSKIEEMGKMQKQFVGSESKPICKDIIPQVKRRSQKKSEIYQGLNKELNSSQNSDEYQRSIRQSKFNEPNKLQDIILKLMKQKEQDNKKSNNLNINIDANRMSYLLTTFMNNNRDKLLVQQQENCKEESVTTTKQEKNQNSLKNIMLNRKNAQMLQHRKSNINICNTQRRNSSLMATKIPNEQRKNQKKTYQRISTQSSTFRKKRSILLGPHRFDKIDISEYPNQNVDSLIKDSLQRQKPELYFSQNIRASMKESKKDEKDKQNLIKIKRITPQMPKEPKLKDDMAAGFLQMMKKYHNQQNQADFQDLLTQFIGQTVIQEKEREKNKLSSRQSARSKYRNLRLQTY